MKWLRAAAVVGVLFPADAYAIDRDACAIPYEQAQALRKEHIFSAAREQAEACRARCPASLAADCAQWSAEIKALMPTVIFRAHDADGNSISLSRATVDGTLLSDAPGDIAEPVDPGEHVFGIEAKNFERTEVHAKLNEGEHARVIEITLTPIVPSLPMARKPWVTSPRAAASLTPAYTLLGIGAIGLTSGAALAIAGFVEKANLAGTGCAPYCDETSVSGIRTVWWAGGIAAGAGVASIAVGAALFATATSGANSTRRASFWTPVIGLGRVGVQGEF